MMRIALAWIVLLLFLAELLMARGRIGPYAPLVGLAMIAVVVTCFMRLQKGSPLMHVFALAGLFWLCLLVGLGSVDFLTRTDHAVGQELAQPGQAQP